MSNRHLARTLVLQSLFQWDFNQQKENLKKLLEFNKSEFAPDFDDQGFADHLVEELISKIKDIDALIIKYAPEWPLDQITPVDRNVLRIGIYELKYAQDIPPKVAINESIELAKTYSGISAGKFINGVLGSIYKDMQEKGEKKELEKEPVREYSAGGVVYRKEGDDYKFVMIYDAYDKWTFPKGHIEENEDQEKAAVREVSEEVGVKKLDNKGYLGSIDIKVNEPNKRAVPKTVHYYLFETTDIDLKIPDEPGVQDVKWLDMEQLLETIGYENAKEIFVKALEILKLK
ncbi:transcription antitermination factor NusB [bacterium]|jgi:transcription antitermination protein NusB|nr:transcription antitermination factor NusB [bacterium]MBT4763568.1 transcription antitermination factor NusB [bacterium]MBT5400940.1 transcription antitermination factor NusB [bacterium]MBT5942259.1 transcription antitermination factor NusB [bacterium]MBT6068100.1 transcription antitermination factor NusB [bacterium]